MWLPELLLIAFVPGALLFRAPIAARDRRARLAAEERVFWSVVISVAWSSVVVLALAAASRYTFSAAARRQRPASRAPRWWSGASGCSTAARRRGRTPASCCRSRSSRSGSRWPSRSSEVIIGGKDPGVVHQRGDRHRQGRRAAHPRPVRGVASARRARSLLPAVPRPGILQPPLHGVLPGRPAGRHRRRAVPAPLPGLDRDRLRPRRHHRRAARGRRLGRAGPAGGLLRRRAADRAGSRVLRVGPAGPVASSRCGSAATRTPRWGCRPCCSRDCSPSRGRTSRTTASSRRSPASCSACCSSCVSTPSWRMRASGSTMVAPAVPGPPAAGLVRRPRRPWRWPPSRCTS